MRIVPNGHVLGATVEDCNIGSELGREEFAQLLGALSTHGVLRIPNQHIDAAQLKRFASQFGTLEINVANSYQEPGHPEVMVLSNIVKDGKPVGLSDAGQDWHTDMSYSRELAFSNVLYGLTIPRRNGQALGGTEFASMYAAYDALPEEIRERLANATATHDFNKFWEEMRRRPGSTRPPLSPEQRAKKPPVSQPMFLRHPVTGRMALYANPGYAISIDGWDEAESDKMLAYLFEHQLQAKFRYKHVWTENDVLMWDNLCTIHNAWPDYGPDEHRLIKRCQVMADKVFEPDFAALAAKALRQAA
jgi:taurine dioxygenase